MPAVSADDELTYLREFEHGTLARLLLAEGVRDRDDAIDRCRDPPRGTPRCGRPRRRAATGVPSIILVVLALGRHARGEIAAARRGPRPGRRPGRTGSLGPGVPRRRGSDDGAADALSPVERGARRFYRELRAAAGSTSGRDAPRQALVEPLSERELDVLRLLRSDLDGPDMARELHISLNTLRTHTKNIYTKLGVNSRRAAIRRADELSLFSGTRGRPSG